LSYKIALPEVTCSLRHRAMACAKVTFGYASGRAITQLLFLGNPLGRGLVQGMAYPNAGSPTIILDGGTASQPPARLVVGAATIALNESNGSVGPAIPPFDSGEQ